MAETKMLKVGDAVHDNGGYGNGTITQIRSGDDIVVRFECGLVSGFYPYELSPGHAARRLRSRRQLMLRDER